MSDAGSPFGRRYLERQYAQSDNLRVRYETHARYSERTESFQSWVMPFLDVHPEHLVCDAGCGPGAYHPAIAERGGHVLAFDLSAGMLREAYEQARERGLDVRLAQASAMRIPLRDGVCDGLLAAHMLYYLPDVAAALREMRRVLKPGGRIMITAGIGGPSWFDQIEEDAANALGVAKLTANSARRFSLDDGDAVRSVFPHAALHVREDALVFPSAEPAMRYWLSFAPDQVRGDVEREALLPRIAEQMRALIERIIERDGEFRVPKGAGCFAADVER